MKRRAACGILSLLLSGAAYGAAENFRSSGQTPDWPVIAGAAAAVLLALVGIGCLISCELANEKAWKIGRILRKKHKKINSQD